MSFILDALRKSEHERQMRSGQNTGILYQVEVRKNQYPLLIPALFLIAILLVLVLIWLMLPNPNQHNFSNTINQSEIIKSANTQTNPQIKNPVTPTIPEKHSPENSPKKVHASPQVNNQTPQPANQEKNTKQSNLAINKYSTGVDPLSGLPPINISGYIHNEQNGNLAMINNKLVHEGEEIFPGLLLIKILDNSAIFSYKGYVFTR